MRGAGGGVMPVQRGEGGRGGRGRARGGVVGGGENAVCGGVASCWCGLESANSLKSDSHVGESARGEAIGLV